MNVKRFYSYWLGGTIGVLSYALIDRVVNPSLTMESGLSLTPDLNRAGDLLHWGGRLIAQGFGPLVVINAILIGGVIALLVSWAMGDRGA